MTRVDYVTVDGIRTRYLEAGTGSPVVLIHGGQFGSYYSAGHWDLNTPELSRHFRTIAVDKLGQGETDNPATDREYTMSRVIEHCRSFIQSLGLRDIALVGHSRGALPAARLALDPSMSVAKLVLVDTNTLAADHPSTPTDFYSSIDARYPPEPDEDAVRLEPFLNSYSTDHVTPDFVAELLRIARLPKTREVRVTIDRVRDQFLRDGRRQRDIALDSIRAGELRIPTLVVWGANDRSAPVALGYDLFQHISMACPETELHVFNHAAHYVFRERAAEFNAVVSGFLRG